MNQMHRFVRACALVCALGGSIGAQAGSFDDFFKALRNDGVTQLRDLAFRGFDMNTRNEDGQPPLVIAIKEDAVKSAEYMIRLQQMDINARNYNDESPLMIAALRGHLGLVKQLLERDAEVNKPGWTPLHYAATSSSDNSVKIVELLLENYAYIDAASPNGSTPLMMAARYGDSRVVQLLLDAGADPTPRNSQGMSAIDFANGAGRTFNVQLISSALKQRLPKGSW